jgi:hypothetical protein
LISVKVTMPSSEYFLEKAEQLFRLSRADCVAAELEAMGNEFIAKAVEIETVAQRAKRRFTPAGAGTTLVAAENE